MAIKELVRLTVVIILFLNVGTVQCQVELSKETTKKEEKEKKAEKVKAKNETDGAGTTSIYFNANWSYTDRRLMENEGLFGKPLGERENETSLNKWSFGLGFRNQLHPNIALEAGIALMQNGEQYSFEDVDTLFAYKTSYSYIAMPIKLFYTYGDEIKLLAGVGITPQMFMRYQQEQNWTTSSGTTESETVKSTVGYNNFVISATVSLGVQFKIAERWSLQVVPEYRVQLNSSNSRNDAYKHYASAIGGNVGLLVNL